VQLGVPDVADVRLEIARRGLFLTSVEMSNFINEHRGRPILRMNRESANDPHRVSWFKTRKLASELPECENACKAISAPKFQVRFGGFIPVWFEIAFDRANDFSGQLHLVHGVSFFQDCRRSLVLTMASRAGGNATG
jgi:hypothetical protein